MARETRMADPVTFIRCFGPESLNVSELLFPCFRLRLLLAE
jgi:hypothetical protein